MVELRFFGGLSVAEVSEATRVDPWFLVQIEEIVNDLHACHAQRPEVAMVDSAKGISNFHVPSDVIVDASMPAMIRNGGQMWGADGRAKDTKAVMPESTFARIYQEMINFCKTHGAFDPATGTEGLPELLNLPAAMHGWHANYLGGRDADACAMCHPALPSRHCLQASSATRPRHLKVNVFRPPNHLALDDASPR